MAQTAKQDRQEMIRKVTDLFWKKGFHATSMRNRQQAIDLRPGSIYASFGSKENLFLESLRHYADLTLVQLATCTEASGSPLATLKTVIKDSVTGCSSRPSGMCMLVKSVAELTADNADLLAEAKRLLGAVEEAFAAILSEARRRGELDASKDPERLARLLQMQLMGLRAYVTANDAGTEVGELIDDAFACLTR